MKKLLIVTIILAIAGVVQAAKLIANGATSQSVSVVIYNSDGDPNTSGLTITNLDLYCQLDGHAQGAKTDLAACTSDHAAWSSGKAFHQGNGLYRIDIPDANLSDGNGSMLTYIIVDAVSHNRTAYYEVQLNAPVDVNAVDGAPPMYSGVGKQSVADTMRITMGTVDDDPNTGSPNANAQMLTGDPYAALGTFATGTAAGDIAAVSAPTVDDILDSAIPGTAYTVRTALAAVTADALAAKTAAEKIDTNTELRTLLTGADTAVAKESSVTGITTSMRLQTGTVATAGNATTFTLSSGFPAVAKAYPRGTILTFTDTTTGAIYVGPVRNYTAGRVVTMYQPLPAAPELGDAVALWPMIWTPVGF